MRMYELKRRDRSNFVIKPNRDYIIQNERSIQTQIDSLRRSMHIEVIEANLFCYHGDLIIKPHAIVFVNECSYYAITDY
jgi:predicted ATP-grasp superfamily ATP-dependent carboligase